MIPAGVFLLTAGAAALVVKLVGFAVVVRAGHPASVSVGLWVFFMALGAALIAGGAS